MRYTPSYVSPVLGYWPWQTLAQIRMVVLLMGISAKRLLILLSYVRITILPYLGTYALPGWQAHYLW